MQASSLVEKGAGPSELVNCSFWASKLRFADNFP